MITRLCCALALLVTAAAAGVALWASYGVDRDFPTAVDALDGAVGSLSALLFVGVGVLIVLRGHGHVIGRLLVLTGLGLILFVAGLRVGDLVRDGVAVPMGRWVAWLGSWVWLLMLAGIWLTLLLFPDGRAAGRTARATVVLCLAVTVPLLLVLPFRPELVDMPGMANPLGSVPVLGALADPLYTVLDPMLFVLFPLTLLCVGLRYRGGGPEVRAQIRWLGWSALLVVVGIVGGLVAPPSWTVVTDVAKLVTLPLLPAVIGISVLRYRLYDVDRLLSRTVSYALLTGMLVAVYVGVVALAGVLAPAASGSVGVAAATLAAVSLVRPLRRVLQRAVDRRFDRAHHDARLAVDGYADALRAADPDRDHETDLLHVLDRTVAPTTAWLWQPGRVTR